MYIGGMSNRMDDIDKTIDLTLMVGNYFAADTREVANALFGGDIDAAYRACDGCRCLTFAGYSVNGGVEYDKRFARLSDGSYAPAIWQVNTPVALADDERWWDITERAQDWEREDAAEFVRAVYEVQA